MKGSEKAKMFGQRFVKKSKEFGEFLKSGVRKNNFAGNYSGRALDSFVEEQMHSKMKTPLKKEMKFHKMVGQGARREAEFKKKMKK